MVRSAMRLLGVLAGAGIALLSASGCSGGKESGPATPPVTVTITTDAQLVAVDDGTGWRRLAPASPADGTVYAFEAAGRYGVALVAPDAQVRLYQLTTGEVTSLRRIFEPPAQTYSFLSGTVSNLAPPYYSMLVTNQVNSSTGGSPRTFTNFPMLPGLLDFMGVEFSPDTSTRSRFLFIRRDLSGDASLGGVEADFAGAAPFATVPATAVGGRLASGLLTRNGTRVQLGALEAGTAGALLLPSAGLLPGDQLWLQGSLTDGGHTQWHKNLDARAPPAEVTMDFTGITRYAPTFVQATRSFTGLGWAAPARCPPFVGDLLVAAHQGTPYAIWYAWVSKEWLGSATSYALPDLSGVTRWSAAWTFPAAGGSVNLATLRWLSTTPLQHFLERDVEFYQVNRGVPVPGLDLLITGADDIDI